jgi:transcriptional regulator with XRE-family HTH domain
MPDAESSALSAFAAELRSWRKRADWTQVVLGDKIGYSDSFISDIERCARTPPLDLAAACDREFGTPGTFERLHERVSKEAYSPWFSPFVHMESAACRIHSWDARFFTGLLQTPDYAYSIVRAAHPEWPAERVEHDVSARMDRQKIFERGADEDQRPPSCWYVIGETAFHSTFGSTGVMRDQIDHITRLSSEPWITVQVYPFAVPDCPGSDGPVTVFDFADKPSEGYAEGYEAGRVIQTPADVARLTVMFDHLRASALSPRDSATWIAAYRREL